MSDMKQNETPSEIRLVAEQLQLKKIYDLRYKSGLLELRTSGWNTAQIGVWMTKNRQLMNEDMREAQELLGLTDEAIDVGPRELEPGESLAESEAGNVSYVNRPKEARAVAAWLRCRDLKDLDYKRALLSLKTTWGYEPEDTAKLLGIPREQLDRDMQKAEALMEVPKGFSGATPKEICERYSAGWISREQLIDELACYPYAPMGETDGYDWLYFDPPGAWSEVDEAEEDGLIDEATRKDISHSCQKLWEKKRKHQGQLATA